MEFDNPETLIGNRLKNFVRKHYVFVLVVVYLVVTFLITESGIILLLFLSIVIGFWYRQFLKQKNEVEQIQSIEVEGERIVIYFLNKNRTQNIYFNEIKEIIINQYYLPNHITLKIKKQTGTKLLETDLEIHFMDSEIWRKIAERWKIQLSIIYKVEENTVDTNNGMSYIILKSNQGISLIDWEKYVEKHFELVKWERNQYYNFKQLPTDLPTVHNFMLLTQTSTEPILVQHLHNTLVLSNVPKERYENIQKLIETFALKPYDKENRALVYKDGVFRTENA